MLLTGFCEAPETGPKYLSRRPQSHFFAAVLLTTIKEMSPAAKQEMLTSPSAEEIFSLAAGVAAALETRDGANTARDEKSHQGIFFNNRRPRVSPIWIKWSGTHQDRSRVWSKTVLGPTIYLYDGANSVEEVEAVAPFSHGTRKGTESTSYYPNFGVGPLTTTSEMEAICRFSLSNSTGAFANTYAYDSFGKLTASTGTLTNPFQYTGREFDSETGLY